MSRILIFKEKYGERYFDASTPELTAAACAKILAERHKEGYWYYKEYEDAASAFTTEEQQTLDLTDEQIAALPDSLRAKLEQQRAALRGRRGAYARAKAQEDDFFIALNLVLSVPAEEAYKFTTDDVERFKRRRPTSLAVELIDIRSDGEYEGYDFADLE